MKVFVVTKHLDLDDREVLGVSRDYLGAQAIVDRFDTDRPADEFWVEVWEVGGKLVDTLRLTKLPQKPPFSAKVPLCPWGDDDLTPTNPGFKPQAATKK